MKKKEYIMPATKVKEMNHRLSLLAGSPETNITSGGDGEQGAHGEAKENSIFDLDLAEDEE